MGEELEEKRTIARLLGRTGARAVPVLAAGIVREDPTALELVGDTGLTELIPLVERFVPVFERSGRGWMAEAALRRLRGR
jgi:hypothetical protein